MNGKPGRTAEQQHSMLLHAIDVVHEQAGAEYRAEEQQHSAVEAAVRNQEIQALTLIALELREMRRLQQAAHRRVGGEHR